MTDQKAPEGLQERPEPPSGHRAVRGAENGPQTATHGLALRKLIAGTIRDTPARYPDDIADAVWRVVQTELAGHYQHAVDAAIAAERCAETAEKRLRIAHQARRAKEHQLDDIRRALCDIGFMEDDDPYSHADLADVIRQNGQAPAHNAGPTVAECATQDRAYWTDKHAGDQP